MLTATAKLFTQLRETGRDRGQTKMYHYHIPTQPSVCLSVRQVQSYRFLQPATQYTRHHNCAEHPTIFKATTLPPPLQANTLTSVLANHATVIAWALPYYSTI